MPHTTASSQPQTLARSVTTSSVVRCSPTDTPETRSSSKSNQTIGYHNTFHSRAQPVLDDPPSYDRSQHDATRRWAPTAAESVALPAYTCTIQMEGVLGMQQELAAPFTAVKNAEWRDVYVILKGTSLSIHDLKGPRPFSKTKDARAGRLIRQYSLQHTEVGVATDHVRPAPKPRGCLGHMIPPAAREEVYERDPHLFHPVRDFVFRIRPETEQFLLCASTPSELMDWIEAICAAVDISQPLEDRSEPRYRSLPRRTRRQRELEDNMVENIENLSLDAEGQEFVEEQTRILQSMYPNLARNEIEQAVVSAHQRSSHSNDESHDPEADDLDVADLRSPSPCHETFAQTLSTPVQETETSADARPSEDYFSLPVRSARHSSDEETPESSDLSSNRQPYSRNRKPIPRPLPSEGHILRHRRRCAPVLLASSPRHSDIVLHEGRRMRVQGSMGRLIPFEQGPPRYESHKFPAAPKSSPVVTTALPSAPVERPALRNRNTSLSSIAWSTTSEAADLAALPALLPTTSNDSISTEDLAYPSPPALGRESGFTQGAKGKLVLGMGMSVSVVEVDESESENEGTRDRLAGLGAIGFVL